MSDNRDLIHRKEIVNKLLQFLERERPQSQHLISPDTDLIAAGILDSLLIVSVVLFIEEELGCSLEFDDLIETNFSSVTSMANLVIKPED